MKFFSSSMLLRDRSVGEAIDTLARSGYDGVEIWVDHAMARAEEPSALAARAKAAGLGVTVHASSYDVNLSAANPGIRAESVRQTVQSVRFAADVGAEIVVVHPGRMSSSRDQPDDFWPVVLSSLEAVDDLAGELGVLVCIELMERRPKEVAMLPEDAERLMAHGYRHSLLTIDLAHAYTHGGAVPFLQRINPEHVRHIHLSDSDPKTVHLPLGEGDADLAATMACLKATGYDRIVNVEGYAPGRSDDLVISNRAVLDDISTRPDSSRVTP